MPLQDCSDAKHKRHKRFVKNVCAPCASLVAQLEDELEGELHLPAPLLAGVASKIVLVIEVAIWRRTIYAVQHVISRETKLDVESLADCRDRKILEERSIPVKLLPPAKDVAAERANLWRFWSIIREPVRRIAGEDCLHRTSEGAAIELEPLCFLGPGRCWISNQIHAAAVARDVEYRTTLPVDDVV